MPEPVYEVVVDEEAPTRMTASTIIAAWQDTVPDLAARILDLLPGSHAIIFEAPRVRVWRVS